MEPPRYEYVATYTATVIDGNMHESRVFVRHYHSILEMRTDLLGRRFEHGRSNQGIRFFNRIEGHRGLFAPTWPEVQVEHTDGRKLSNPEWDALLNGTAIVGLP